MVKKLLHTRYRVTDLEKTVAFYKDVLGLQEVRRHTSGRGSQLVFLKAAGSEEEIEVPIQVNGKNRSRMVVPAGLAEAEFRERALGDEKIQEHPRAHDADALELFQIEQV